MKRCNKCGVEKHETEFHRRPERPCGVRSTCKSCANKIRVLWGKAHPDNTAASLARSYRKRRKKQSFLPLDEQLVISKKHADRAAGWRKDNPGKNAASVAKWDKAHPGKAARYRARRFYATPAWANEFFIEEIYDLARRRTKATGIEWEVDHIVPLNSKKVCGLHVEYNLQVIPAKLNRSKGNRWWPDMPETIVCGPNKE